MKLTARPAASPSPASVSPLAAAARLTKAGPDGYLLLRKIPGQTSFDSLSLVKRGLGSRKVGHAGTLDKFAEGLLVVLAGRATRLAPWFSSADKTYLGVIRFGTETDTLDPEGSVIADGPLPSREDIEAAIPGFTGGIMQRPPLYSAIHVDGKRAYKIARGGGELMPETALPPRPVHIHELRLLSYNPPFGEIEVSCSKGTYIRSLARDMALAAGSRGSLVSLKRTRIGGFLLEDAFTLQDQIDPLPGILGALRRIDEGALKALGLPCCRVDKQTAGDMIHGKPLAPLVAAVNLPVAAEAPMPAASAQAEAPAIGVFSESGEFVGIIEFKNNSWRYGFVYAGV